MCISRCYNEVFLDYKRWIFTLDVVVVVVVGVWDEEENGHGMLLFREKASLQILVFAVHQHHAQRDMVKKR